MKKFMLVLLSVLLVFAVCSCATTEKVNYPLTYVLTEDTYSTLVNALFEQLELTDETLAEYGGAETVKGELKAQLIAQIPTDAFRVVLTDEKTITVETLNSTEQKAPYKLEEGVLTVDWESDGNFVQVGRVEADFSVLYLTTTNISGFALPLFLSK